MITSNFYDELLKNGVNFFCGVPDSLLKDFCAYVSDNSKKENHIICANEGNAVAMAAGSYLATGKPSVVYMQNSGLGNIINPILSLADEKVYSIPMLMLVGWRGEPSVKDEPQHIKQGEVTLSLLEASQISYEILSDDFDEAKKQLQKAFTYMEKEKKPYALVVRKGCFEKYSLQNKKVCKSCLSREDALKSVIDNLSDKDVVVASTGMISREIFEYRKEKNQGHHRDFLTVGSMGHASSIALGIAKNLGKRNVFCIEGDGALLMHMGALPVISSLGVSNFKHIIINNEAHDSVGGQPTVADCVDICSVAKACGYQYAKSVSAQNDIGAVFREFVSAKGPALLEILVKKGARADLGRPTISPVENKKNFMEFLNG